MTGKEILLHHLAWSGEGRLGERSGRRPKGAGEYDVEPDRCEKDLQRLLDRLGAEGLLEVKGEAPA